MLTERTECGIDVPNLMPTLCGICVKQIDCQSRAAYFVGAMPLFEVPDPDRDDDELILDSEFGCPKCGDPSSITTVEEGGDFKCRQCGHEWNPIGDTPLDPGPKTSNEDLEWKAKFAEREAEQERTAFASDYRAGDFGAGAVLQHFPLEGRFEDNIYRPSACELCGALPDYEPTIQNDQLVLLKEVAPGAVVHVWTSIQVGQIAGGVGDDSIRVTRQDNGKFWFKTNANWIARTVPAEADTPEKAAAHLAEKIRQNVVQMTGTCPKCGAVTVKCNMNIPGRYWWKCAQRCRS